jgi:tRNA G10  N-methylase Trm11
MVHELPGALVFDAYMGTASALKASLKLGHSFVGFEVDHKRMKRYEKIIRDFQSKK